MRFSVDLSARPRQLAQAVRKAAVRMQTDGNPIMITNRAEEPIAAIVPVPQVPTVKELWLEPEEK